MMTRRQTTVPATVKRHFPRSVGLIGIAVHGYQQLLKRFAGSACKIYTQTFENCRAKVNDPTVGVGVIAGAFGLLVAESFGLFVLDAEERGDLLALWRDLASGAAPIPTAEHLP